MTRPVPQRTPSGSLIVARARRHLPAVLCMVAGGAWAQAPDEVRRAAVIEEIVGLFEQLLAAPELVMVQAELGLEARRQPELLTVLQPWRVSLLRIVESIVRDADTAEPDQLAITLVAALEGVVLAGLQEAGGERAAYLRSSVTLLLGGLA